MDPIKENALIEDRLYATENRLRLLSLAFARYAKHDSDCPIPYGGCNCGLQTAWENYLLEDIKWNKNNCTI